MDLERGGADAHLGLKITQALTALENKDDYKKMFFNADKTGKADWVWRVPFDELGDGNVRERIIEDVADVINRTHPWGAPWKLLLKELYQGEVVHRDYLQVYRQRGRQPMHLDSGTPWFEVNGKKMCILSSVLHLTDGVATKMTRYIACARQ